MKQAAFLMIEGPLHPELNNARHKAEFGRGYMPEPKSEPQLRWGS